MDTMTLDFNWINLLILFGALQGLLFGIILLFNKKHPGAKFLGIFMFVLAYNGFETFNWSSNLDKHFIFFDLFSFVTIYALGPSLYLYIKSLFYPEKKILRKNFLPHYIPMLFQLTFRSGIVITYFLIVKGIITDQTLFKSMVWVYHLYSEQVSVMVFLVYLFMSWRVFMSVQNSNKIALVSKEMQREAFKWIRALLLFMTIMGIAWLITILVPYLVNLSYDFHYYPLELALVAFIYWIGFVGYLRINMIFRQKPRTIFQAPSITEAKQLMAQLRHSMETDKLYLNPELNRNKLASHTGINAKTLSTTLNQHSRQNFNDFVNTYRVKEVCKRLVLEENQHLTISGIALQSGFNSQATFQRVFKSVTGMSPREYMKKQEKQGERVDSGMS